MYSLFQEICGLKNLRLNNYIMLVYVCELLYSLVQILVLKSNRKAVILDVYQFSENRYRIHFSFFTYTS